MSARAIAGLLLRLRYIGGAARYTSFSERGFLIPARPVQVGAQPLGAPAEPVSAPGNGRMEQAPSAFTEQNSDLFRRLGRQVRTPAGAAEYEFMHAQLRDYDSARLPYGTARLEGERLSEPASAEHAIPTARLHVYEMYWADLSRLGTGVLRIFGELYQILFHIAQLGQNTVDHARAAYGNRGPWRAFGATHQTAVRLLTAVIPALWLSMLTTGIGAVATRAPFAFKYWLVILLGALLAAILYSFILYRLRGEGARYAVLWLGAPAVFAVAAAALWLQLHLLEQRFIVGFELLLDRRVMLIWLAASGGLLYWIYRKYELVRPGAFVTGMSAFGVFALPTLLATGRASSRDELFAYTMRVFEVEVLLTALAWYALFVVGLTAAALGWRAARSMPGSERGTAYRACWTAQGTLAIAAASLLLFTTVLWAALLRTLRNVLAGIEDPRPLVPLFDRGAEHYAAYLLDMLQVTAGAGFPMLLVGMALMAALMVLAYFPPVLREIFPPRAGDTFEAGAQESAFDVWKRSMRENRTAENLGNWLTRGNVALMYGVSILFLLVFLVQPAASMVNFATSGGIYWLAWLESNALQMILVLGGVLAGAGVGVLVLSTRFNRLALGFRPMLDAILDVDNYMREHPRDATPRARIAERYASLLRYLCNWRSSDGRPYDAIILVAHSQGTVITAELLGFLRKEHDPELAPITGQMQGGDGTRKPRVYLFTMGSPLRQLYHACFPHLFGWVRGSGRPWGENARLSDLRRPVSAVTERTDERHVVTGPAIPYNASPDPWDFGITRWVNAYRTGDYVGRALWRPELASHCAWTYRYAPDTAAAEYPNAAPPIIYVSEDAERSRRELCIGAGAHMHYWDETAKAIAVELDFLISEACGVAAPVGLAQVGVAARKV